ncbi:MAG TPA: coproporphyrinogen-III oxidase family protein, partial [Verrucomicrobiae bacterium]|nr:coproporphyrinogen-III oxidase family protein [Verrucomicrobiae bacterium]
MSGLGMWAPRAVALGAYVHIPFCTQRCGYCSFNTAPDAPGAVARFVPALLGEIGLAAKAPWAAAIRLKSVFLGGGTPSLLPPEAMAAILDRLRAHFPIEPSAEITVECNPESVSVERLAGYREAGVTRISLGVQSLDDRILPTLDRLHTAAQAREAFDAARAAGFSDVSADLIYGLPGLDLPTWEATVKGVLGWQPDHLSAYALTLDEGSLWHARGVSAGRGETPPVIPPEETTTAQYRRMTELAGEAGFEHYEVCLPRELRHPPILGGRGLLRRDEYWSLASPCGHAARVPEAALVEGEGIGGEVIRLPAQHAFDRGLPGREIEPGETVDEIRADIGEARGTGGVEGFARLRRGVEPIER